MASFPFVDAPDSRAIRDGINLLVEIGALRALENSSSSQSGFELTPIGRDLARLPIDPRLGRMLLAGKDAGCASEILIIVAALSIQDVRERPLDHQESADTAHARFTDPHSDFLTYLNLWRYLHIQQRDLSGTAFRRMCRAEFIHYLRFREWRDIAHQLRDMARTIGIHTEPIGIPSAGDVVDEASRAGIADAAARAAVAYTRSTSAVDTDDIHRSILVGLLSSLGAWDPVTRDYTGSRGTHFTIWPGSGITGHPDWVMTAELVETSRLFARTVARIRPEWVEPLAKDLLTRVYSEPTWNSSRGAAYVQEKVMLYGLTLIADRPVLLGRLGATPLGSIRGAMPSDSPFAAAVSVPVTAAELAREMFIRHALVQGQWRERHAKRSAGVAPTASSPMKWRLKASLMTFFRRRSFPPGTSTVGGKRRNARIQSYWTTRLSFFFPEASAKPARVSPITGCRASCVFPCPTSSTRVPRVMVSPCRSRSRPWGA